LGKLNAEDKVKTTDKTEQIKHHLLEKEIRLKQALADLRLNKNHVLFVDGIDYRPEGIGYQDYLSCVKGLGEAVWQLNVDFFHGIRDSKGRIKIVLLVRPDVFHSLNLYNSNSRVRDNAVLLEWSTTEHALRSSNLYEATGKYFASQQDHDVSPVAAADHYLASDENDGIFRRLLRTSFQKPRDLLTFVKIARSVSIRRLNRGNEQRFKSDIVRNSDFTREYSDYLLGEVLNYSAFYMSQDDFFLYIKFFQYLDGNGEFKYEDFSKAFEGFKNWIRGETVKATEYFRDAQALLQFFYDVNIVGYQETVGDSKEKFTHFSYREKTLTNIAPKIKTTGILIINIGVYKALDIGMRVKSVPENTPPVVVRRSRRSPSRNAGPRDGKAPTASGKTIVEKKVEGASLTKKSTRNTPRRGGPRGPK
jgi:hypothetical protein